MTRRQQRRKVKKVKKAQSPRHELNLARQVLKRANVSFGMRIAKLARQQAATQRKPMTAELFMEVMRANRRTK